MKTVEDYFEQIKGNITDKEYKNTVLCINKFVDWVSQDRLMSGEVTQQEVKDYCNNTNSVATAKRRMISLRKFLNFIGYPTNELEKFTPQITTEKKYLSKSELEKGVKKVREDMPNGLYLSSMIRLVYLGYAPLENLSKLRPQDIKDNKLIIPSLSKDREVTLYLPDDLVDDLIKLSSLEIFSHTCTRNPKFVGKYPDSCFKSLENTKGKMPEFKRTFNRHLNNTKECFGIEISSKVILMSGLVHRIFDEMEKQGYSKEDVMSDNKQTQFAVNKIIEKVCDNSVIKFNRNIKIDVIKAHFNDFID